MSALPASYELTPRQRCAAAARLLKRMLPQAQAIAFFDADGRMLALSEDCSGELLVALMQAATQGRSEAGAMRASQLPLGLGGCITTLPWQVDGAEPGGAVSFYCAPDAVAQLPALADLDLLLRPLLRQFDTSPDARALPARRARIESVPVMSPAERERLQALLHRVRVHLGADAILLDFPLRAERIVELRAGLTAHAARRVLDPCSAAPRLSRRVLRGEGEVAARLTLVRDDVRRVFTDAEEIASARAASEIGALLARGEDALPGSELARPCFEALARAAWQGGDGRSGTLLVVTLENLDAMREALGGVQARAAVEWTLQRLTTPTLPMEAIATQLDDTRFAVHVPGCAGADACELLRQVRRELSGLRLGYPPLALEFSVGLADATGAVDFDAAMAAAHQDAQATTVVLELPAIDTGVLREASLGEPQLRDILALERLRLYAQPIEAPQPSRRARFEVLLRVEAPGGALDAPAQLLAAAGRAGRLADVDRWVVLRAVDSLRHWRRALPDRSVQMCINLSEDSVADPRFAEFVESTIVESQVPPEWLCFEAPDRSVERQGASLARLFRRLRDLGCGRALDDFDCESRGFALREDLPVSTLAVDATLVGLRVPDASSILHRAADRGLTIERGIEVRAKRVESSEAGQRMRRAGIQLLQGYAVARPRPLRALLSDLAHA